MAKKSEGPKNVAQAQRIYEIEGDKLKRLRKECPKCGPGTYMAEHADRKSCGKCGYTEFKGA